MGPKVAKDELEDIVGEAQRLHDADRNELTRGEVREVLRDLDIPPEKLDEAERLVKERRAKQRENRRSLMVAAVLVIAVAGLVTTTVVYTKHKAARAAKTWVAHHAVTSNGKASPFERSGSPEVRLDAEVAEAPVGDRLDLSCEWVEPSGTRAHENRYTTKSIDRALWPTHCRYTLAPSSPTGTWTVTLKQSDRSLTTEHFDVR